MKKINAKGEGQSSCRRCLHHGIWNRSWTCFLYQLPPMKGYFCNECADKLVNILDDKNYIVYKEIVRICYGIQNEERFHVRQEMAFAAFDQLVTMDCLHELNGNIVRYLHGRIRKALRPKQYFSHETLIRMEQKHYHPNTDYGFCYCGTDSIHIGERLYE